MVQIFPQTRKKQEEARAVPGRVNYIQWHDPLDGIYKWSNLCVCSLMQGWAVRHQIWRWSVQELATTHVLSMPGTRQAITGTMVAEALKRNATARGEDVTDVVPQCLRRTPLTQLANSGLASDPMLIALAAGHKSVDTSKIYVEPELSMAAKITKGLKEDFVPLPKNAKTH